MEVAETCDPAELHQVIGNLRAALYPEDLDEAWGRGMDREDIAVNKLPDGWHVTGFLSVVAGTKFKTILNALAKPRDRDDDRSASVRRVEALDEMLTSELEHGLPTDVGIRPQLNVMVDVETLLRQQCGDSVVPAVELEGFGPIGPKLASCLICNASTTALLTDGQTQGPNRQANILDVGRAYRVAVPKQRKAVLARQHGICAAPGCTNTHLEIHHVYWWAQHHGQTNLDNLIGICSRCHHLVHRELLHIRPDGHGGFHIGDTTRVTRSTIKHLTYSPHDYSDLETELRLLLIEERRRIRPIQNTEYQPTQHQLAPPVTA